MKTPEHRIKSLWLITIVKHDIHIKLEFKGGKTEFDSTGIFATTKNSTISVVKSKVSPLINDVPIVIDITKGGTVDYEGSFIWWVSQLTDVMENSRGWYTITNDIKTKYSDVFDKYSKLQGKFRYNELLELAKSDPSIVDIFKIIWMDMIRNTYTLQREVCEKYYCNTFERLHDTLGLKDPVNQDTVDSISDLVGDTDSDNNESSDEES